ncbi:glycoside hydrolase family 16 protein [Moniliophthora roreri MCA 2997]|uniref:Glycoside hydrolase family 16 protein n=2 Tax=Moniliophthora roreri TaxID=221103 RepID=V2XRS9_MONRO|nr:glycoside hydrolase family 16 protein [Moniliophthora roreri MCA 2997]KAI3619930.1 glycoside hydrolase family 16 protein [Moniliophthora roreri]
MHFLSLLVLSLPLLSLAGHGNSSSAFSTRHQAKRSSSSCRPRGLKYKLQDKYRGQDFIDKWNFFSEADPTHGMVDYQTKENAKQKGLAYVQDDGTTILAVDNSTWLSPGSNRASVRISSPKTYNQGLFIADFWSMPYGCSTWPAWWTVGPDWPNGGEIDILEGVHSQSTNQMTLHTSDGCKLAQDTSKGLKSLASGIVGNLNCASSGNDNTGCAFFDTDDRSYGKGFNDKAGGVFAHLWNSEGIKVWFFSRNEIPQDILDGKPNPDGWGQPKAFWQNSSCDINKHFYDHGLTIDTTLCGDWAGATYQSAGCPGTCAQAVADPRNFDNARWKINYIAVYSPA